MSDNLAAEVVCTKLAYQLTPDERVDLLVAVAQSMLNDQLAQGRQQEIAKVFSVLKTAVAQFWKRLIAGKLASLIVKWKKIANKNATSYDVGKLHAKISLLPIEKRQNHRNIAKAIGVSTTTICTLVQRGILICTRQNLKPLLNATHREARLAWANERLGFVQDASNDGTAGSQVSIHTAAADNMMLTVHMDKKCFFAQVDGGKVYLTPKELAPLDQVQHKSHITKVMFLAAVAWPRKVGGYHKVWWDGKIGLLPFAEPTVTKRKSKNRPAGEWIMKPVLAYKDVMRRKTIAIG